MARVAAGDAEAFAVLATRYAPSMARLARAMASDEAAAADIVQDALLDAFRGAATYRAGSGIARPWLFAIARNAARRALRSRGRVVTYDDDAPLGDLGVAAGWGADESVVRAEDRARISRAIASLSPADREVIVLCDVEGLSGAAAAAVLDIEVRALKSRLHRARLRLLNVLREGEGGVMGQSRVVGGLSCGEVLERLGDYVDRELPAASRAEVDAHLVGCSVCERFGGRYAALVHDLRVGLGAAPAVDQQVLTRVLAALDRAD